MTFFLGLVEGAAKSVDKQLQSDMERTQERIDGMAQYRITRRRAEEERKQKDKKELKDVLTQLASYTDGNEDKAIQLYKSPQGGGQTIQGAKDLLSELRKEQKLNVDVRSKINFATNNENPEDFAGFIGRSVDPVTKLPAIEGEMKASGLAGMFGRDIGKEVMQQVDEAAPISEEAVREGPFSTATATIDRSGFSAVLAQEELINQRKRAGREFEMKEIQFDANLTAGELKNKELKQAMRLADQSAKLAQDKFSSAEDQREFENARKKVADLQTEAQLIMDAEKFVKDMELKTLSIEEQKDAAKERKEHPLFKSFEDMAVYASQKLAAGGLSPEDEDMFEKMRTKAFEGAREYNEKTKEAGGTAASFSKINRSSFLNDEIRRNLEKLGMVDELGQVIDTEIEGNYPLYFDRMHIALDNVTKATIGLGDNTMNQLVAGQREALIIEKNRYKKEFAKPKQRKNASTRKNSLTDSFKSTLKAGDVVSYKNDQGKIITRIWTGDRYV